MEKFNFGFEALTQETPLWAKWLFRVTFIVTTVGAFWIAGTGLLEQSSKVEAMLLLKVIDGFIFGLSKLFGVKITNDEIDK